MMESEHFDPFNDRLCRNVRNALSESLPEVIRQKDIAPARRIAGIFLADSPPGRASVYIHRRLAAYQAVLDTLAAGPCETPIGVAFAIWRKGLFFETHEYLESFWMAARGSQKALLQALIRAAGADVHREQGNRKAARRIAGKAIPELEKQRDRLARYTDPDHLIDKLQRLAPDPPRPGIG